MLVDSTVWSLAFRRKSRDLSEPDRQAVEEWARLVRDGQSEIIGPIRQELLTGVRTDQEYGRIKTALAPFPDLQLDTVDFEEAAKCSNRLLAKGIAASGVDALLCAVALRYDRAIYTLDTDFTRYARVFPFRLHVPARPRAS